MTGLDDEATTDFFISYNKADTEWASWIAWQLEKHNFTTVLQAWDFRPGNNFVLAMQDAARTAKRTIAVLTKAYLASNFTKPEWAAAFAQDPTGVDRRLVPVRVEACDVEGILGQVIYIDLVDKDSDEAARVLLAGVGQGRAKPTAPPPFPRVGQPSPSAETTSPLRPLEWRHVTAPPAVMWRTSLDRLMGLSRESGPSTIEVQLVPNHISDRLTVRRLGDLQLELADLGRQGGLFSATQELHARADDSVTLVSATRSRTGDAAGLMVTRDGQRGCWFTLPHDFLGSVFDPNVLKRDLASSLQTLMQVNATTPERFAIPAALRSTTMLTQGSADLVGRRQSATGFRFSSDDIELPVEDTVAFVDVIRHVAEVSDELVARLAARLGARR